MMPFSRGDVVLVRYPNSDRVTYKKRPALVVQPEGVVSDLQNRLVACITTAPRSGPSRVSVAKVSVVGMAMGLLHDSVVLTDDLASVPEIAFEKRIGSCPVMTEVDGALRTALGL